MSTHSYSRLPPRKIKVNWARECTVGTLLSAAFTILAAYSGTQGVVDASLAARMHDFIILGGVTMAMVCGFAGIVVILREIAAGWKLRSAAAPQKQGWSVSRPFGTLQAAKFMKIFLP